MNNLEFFQVVLTVDSLNGYYSLTSLDACAPAFYRYVQTYIYWSHHIIKNNANEWLRGAEDLWISSQCTTIYVTERNSERK